METEIDLRIAWDVCPSLSPSLSTSSEGLLCQDEVEDECVCDVIINIIKRIHQRDVLGQRFSNEQHFACTKDPGFRTLQSTSTRMACNLNLNSNGLLRPKAKIKFPFYFN